MHKSFALLIALSLSLIADVFNDEETGLMWQDNPASKHLKKNWDDSITFCKKLQLSGHDDWRLPSVKELKYLVSKNPRDGGIKKGFVYLGDSGYYWSTDAHEDSDSFAWMFNFKRGYEYSNYKSYERHIRCVRDANKTMAGGAKQP